MFPSESLYISLWTEAPPVKQETDEHLQPHGSQKLLVILSFISTLIQSFCVISESRSRALNTKAHHHDAALAA